MAFWLALPAALCGITTVIRLGGCNENLWTWVDVPRQATNSLLGGSAGRGVYRRPLRLIAKASRWTERSGILRRGEGCGATETVNQRSVGR